MRTSAAATVAPKHVSPCARAAARTLIAALALLIACDDAARGTCGERADELEDSAAAVGRGEATSLEDASTSGHDAAAGLLDLDARATRDDGKSEAAVARMDASEAAHVSSDAGQDASDAAESAAMEARALDAGDAADAAQGRDVRDLLTWVLDALARQRLPSYEELRDHFAPSFLVELPEPELLDTFRQLSEQLVPFALVELYAPSAQSLRGVLASAGGRWSVSIQATSTQPRQILGLWLAPSPSAPPLSYDEAWERLSQLAAKGQLFVGAVSPDLCEPLHEYGDGGSLAIGSAFKLWVLLALEERLSRDPSLTWEASLPVRDALKSLPSGELQDVPAGTQVTLRELARKMIAISDNTATDHLIDLLGREAVEATQAVTRHEHPALNVPWPMTRELFALKVWAPSSLVAQYRAAMVEQKRLLLDELRRLPLDYAAAARWRSPRMLDLEWFASPLDLCRALAVIGTRARFDPGATLLSLLRANVPMFDRGQWPYVGYKGGSEPGVLNHTWLLQRADGRWFAVVLTLNDEQQLIDQAGAFEAVRGLVSQLALDASTL